MKTYTNEELAQLQDQGYFFKHYGFMNAGAHYLRYEGQSKEHPDCFKFSGFGLVVVIDNTLESALSILRPVLIDDEENHG